jgi:hypothetical protein
LPRRRSRVRPPSSAPTILGSHFGVKCVPMKFFVNPRVISVVIAFLVVILIGLTFRFFSDDKSGDLHTISPIVTTTQTLETSTLQSVGTPNPEQLRLLAICSGMDAVVDEDTCRARFEKSNETLSLGERVIFIPSISVSAENLEFSINGDTTPILLENIDAVISGLTVGELHSIRIRFVDTEWSNPITFKMSLQPPGVARLYGVCADLICAPEQSLVAPLNADENAYYPLVELVAGLTDPPTQHMWIELMLNSDDSFIGCLNCQAAETAEVSYEDRKEFGVTGIFYNWDLKNLPSGTYKLQARLRNRLYMGDWSAEFSFEVQRP